MARPRPPRAEIDFESRSACSLKDHGTWVYSRHPTTEVLVMAYRLPGWEEGRTEVWHPAFPHLGIEASPPPTDLFEHVASGGLVEAHNVWFELCLWTNKMRRLHGWPELPLRQLRCSAAKAASHTLPRSLEKAVEALGLEVKKDAEGAKLMKKMVKPRKPRKKEVEELLARGGDPGAALFWRESKEEMLRLFEYCRVDVLAEEGLSKAVPDLSESELAVFHHDLEVNLRGFQLDREAVEAALGIIDRASEGFNRELAELTEGQVLKATQRARMMEWLAAQGLELEDTQGPTLDEAMARKDLSPKAARALRLMRELGRTSTAKYSAMEAWADPDDWRVRGGIIYHGAGTGRWTGAGVQPHNFPRGALKDVETPWELLKQAAATGDGDMVEVLYGDVMSLLSQALRGAIVASPGRQLYVADYAAVESRVIFWLAGAESALEVLRSGQCIYCDMASGIYKHPVDKELHPDKRQLGKQAILGLGFGMGGPKFKDTCAKYGIVLTDAFADEVKSIYRSQYPEVPAMWRGLEAAAIAAIRSPGRQVRWKSIVYQVIGRFLYCRLPSGRLLAYCDPAVQPKATPWGEMRDAMTYMGVDPYTKKWKRQGAYGGLLTENVVQATARDLMAHAMPRCEEAGYEILLSVHDELIAERDLGTGDVREYERLVASVPPWAEGLPLKAEGWRGLRYRK